MPPRDAAGVAGLAVRGGPQEVPRIPDDLADLPGLPLAVQDTLCPELVKAAEEALADAGIGRADAARLGCVTASDHATAATAQYIGAVLDGAGPRWLAPHCFLHYSPHSLTGRLCIDLGLDGTAITLTGAASGVDALGYAAMMVDSGRCPGVLVAAVHWPTPEPAADDRATPLTVAAAVVTAGGARVRLTGWRPGGGHPAVRLGGDRPTAAPADTTAPLAGLAAWYQTGAAGPWDLVAAGSRLTATRGADR